ncbi:MAG: S41 family peptidase [Rikenellaceae bacterium]|nr:S41 family peptidase [Rikenellaceae bacterium]
MAKNSKHTVRPLLAVMGAVAVAVVLMASNPNDFALGRNIEVLINMMRELHVFYVDETDPAKLMKSAAAGMTSTLDPYTEYMPEEEVAEFEMMTTGKYGGVGSLIRQKGDYVRFAEPYKGCPADRAGIKIGDRIIEIDGESAKGMTVDQISRRLKGDPGTEVRLKVARLVDDSVMNLSLTRERISISGVPYAGWLNDSIGYIAHNDFSEGCAADLRRELMTLRQTGRLRGLVLDYRGNGGGIVQEAVEILSMFLPKGSKVLEMKGRTEDMSHIYRTDKEPIDTQLPIVVLTNSGSASAAEIVAGALQDMDRAVLMGRRTFGKGLVQSTRAVGYGDYLKVTTAKYYMPSGRCIQAIDYAHRNDDGSVDYVPDSLIREFTTRGGRKVYDGGGVMPDVVREAEYATRFVVTIYSEGHIEDYADDYAKQHDKRLQTMDPATFSISDAEFEDFVTMMCDRKTSYRSQSSQYADVVRRAAEQERQDSTIMADIRRLERALQGDMESNLRRHREELMDAINTQIILRYRYSAGVTQYNLSDDKDAKAAVELLGNPEEYSRILREQDTARQHDRDE